MSNNFVNKWTNESADEFLRNTHMKTINIDAVGLWEIYANSKSCFELDELEEYHYMYNAILKLLEFGCSPVMGQRNKIKKWKKINTFSGSFDEIASAILEEWRKNGKNENFNDIWLALPHIYEATE